VTQTPEAAPVEGADPGIGTAPLPIPPPTAPAAFPATPPATDRLRRLQAMSHELLTDLSVEGVIATVVQRGLSLIGATAGGVWEIDQEQGALILRGIVGYPPEVEERWRRIQLDAQVHVAETARTAHRIVLRSAAERDERYPELARFSSVGEPFLTAPLVVVGRTIGVIGLGFERGEALDEEALAFVDAAVAQCAAAMHRALVVEAQQHNLAEARETAHRLAALQRVTAGLADARDTAAIVDLVIREATGALGARQVAFCVLDSEAGVLRGIRYHGLSDELTNRFAEFPLAPGLPAADALLERKPIVLHDQSERDDLYPDLSVDEFHHAWVVLPLAIGTNDIGALSLSVPATDAQSSDYVSFLMALADQCAHALDRVRLLARDVAHRQRLELLAEAGRIFSAPLDVRLTSLQLCRLVVGGVADMAAVFLREQGSRYALAAADHVDPQAAALLRDTADEVPASLGTAFDLVLTSGRAGLDHADEDPAAALYFSPLALTSRITLPLVAAGHDIGVLVVGTTGGGRTPFTSPDADELEEIAARLALAIDGARLLRQQTEIAHTLQRSLLPSSLPQVPGAEVAVRYLPGAEGVDVGGDFYDVIPLPSGRIGLVVGDVMGRGVRAAAVMGQLRAAVRSYSLEGHPPAALLSRLDLLVGTLEEGLLVTALYAEWDPERSIVLCSCAGHLPPLLRHPGGRASYLELDPGLPLGVGAQTYAEAEIELPPGALLLAFTDGLVEGPDLPVDDGMAQLLAAVDGVEGAMAACDAALAALRPLVATRTYDDDTALLALHAKPTAAGVAARGDERAVGVLDLAADTASPAKARSYVADMLRQWGLPQLVDPGVLLVSELVTNGVRHAGTALRLVITRQSPQHVRIAVIDRAPGGNVEMRESDESAETGRGLFLVEHLSAGWGSVADDDGKTVWFELRA